MREKILAVIEKNSRIDIHDLAILLGESEVAVANEIAEMEKEHIICGYHTLINWDNTSEEKVVALIEVKVTPQRGMGFDKIAERIYQYSEVCSILNVWCFRFHRIYRGQDHAPGSTVCF